MLVQYSLFKLPPLGIFKVSGLSSLVVFKEVSNVERQDLK